MGSDGKSAAKRPSSIRFIERYLESERSGRLTGLLLGQLDAFNRISATFGQERSDAFCSEYAAQLRKILPAGTPVIRLSDRRFVALLALDSMATVIDVAARLGDEQPPRLRIGADDFIVDVTVGVAVHPTHADDAASLLRRAELALHDARQGELTFEIYRPDSTQQQTTLWKFASDLERAVHNGDLEIYMQPEITVANGQVAGVETLVRWRQESGRLVSPEDFIPFAERSGSIVPLTWFVFEQVARIAQTWAVVPPHFTVAVNVSSQVLDHPEFRDRLATLKRALAARAIGVTVELTEESLVEDKYEGSGKLERIRKMGVGVAIDDFGKGYSSLTYLKEIPATQIKIDKQFIGSVATDPKDLHIVKATIELARAFGMLTVAEGVDNDQSLRVLRELKCDLAQGFFIARPMRADLLADWIGRYTPAPPFASAPAGPRIAAGS
jgi:EAL domain-containing protein (putative c-di-GMP-specific phosphodiesterase class I)/GGDEF domain-containing protein